MLLPTTPQDDSKPLGMLPADKEVVLSDAFIVMRENGGDGEADSARWFFQMLGAVYRAIHLPETEYRDWIGRSEQTLADRESAAEVTVRHYGNLYIRPYMDAEYPDIMVQMSVMASIHARSHMNVPDAPFRIFCDHFIRASERSDSKALSVQIDGGETCWAKLSVLRLDRHKLPALQLRTADGEAVRASRAGQERIEFVSLPTVG